MEENTSATTTENTAAEQTAPDLSGLQAELERLRAENGKLKSAQTNASADASRYKKELQARMTEQERAATETKELIEQLKAENETLKRSQTLAEYKAGFIGQGFEESLAERAAEATHDGKFADLMAAFKDFVTAHDKSLAETAMRSTPRPGQGASGAPSITQEQFDAMEYRDRLKVYETSPELYKKFTSGNNE